MIFSHATVSLMRGSPIGGDAKPLTMRARREVAGCIRGLTVLSSGCWKTCRCKSSPSLASLCRYVQTHIKLSLGSRIWDSAVLRRCSYFPTIQTARLGTRKEKERANFLNTFFVCSFAGSYSADSSKPSLALTGRVMLNVQPFTSKA